MDDELDMQMTIFTNCLIEWVATDIQATISFRAFLIEKELYNRNKGPDDFQEMFMEVARNGHIHAIYHDGESLFNA